MTKQTTSYKLSFHELQGIILFLRDYDWERLKKDNHILTSYIYGISSSMYLKLKKRCLKVLESGNLKKDIKLDFSHLELLSIAILAKTQHENPFINMAINKILLQLPVEIINILKPEKHEQSTY